jgi:hypothetical protein
MTVKIYQDGFRKTIWVQSKKLQIRQIFELRNQLPDFLPGISYLSLWRWINIPQPIYKISLCFLFTPIRLDSVCGVSFQVMVITKTEFPIILVIINY